MDYIVPVIVTVAIMFACYLIFRSWTSDYVIVDTIKDGKKQDVYQNKLPVSANRPAGIEFSYTGWFRIDDFSDRIGVQKVIFVKGSANLNTACPALLIDANTNTLLVKVDTYGAQETIPVVNVPSKKWLHVAIVVGQDFVDVYINGILYAHHILTQLPKQNSANVLTSPDGGFSGRIVRLKYHPQALSGSDIISMAKERPPTGDETNQSFPPYFDLSWFTLQG